MPAQGIFYVHAYVSDLERAKRFYGETLGWRLGTDTGYVAGFSFGEGYLVVGLDDRPEGERRYGGGAYVAVRVDDVEAEHKQLEARGVAVGALTTKAWGERSFAFSDPDGNEWRYCQ